MGRILLGMLLFTIDINLTQENGRLIGLVPDFLGYLCVAWGMREMKHSSVYFAKGEFISMGVAVASGILYLMDLMGFSNVINFTLLAVDMLELIGMLVLLFWIFRGVRDIEIEAQRDLRTDALKIIWIALTVVSAVAYITSLIHAIGGIVSVAAAILAFCYILAFYRCKVAYEEYMADQD